jgi:hypothetical protein
LTIESILFNCNEYFAGMDPAREKNVKRFLDDGETWDITGDYRPGLCRNYEHFGKSKDGEFKHSAKEAVVPGHFPSAPLMSGYQYLDIIDQGENIFFLSSDNKLIWSGYLCSTSMCSTQICSTFSPGTTNGTEFSDLELVSEWKLRDDVMFFPPGVANGTAPEPLPPLPDHFPNDHYGSWQCGCSPGEAVSQCARARYCLDWPPALPLTDFPQKNSLPSELFSEFFKWALTHIPTVRL